MNKVLNIQNKDTTATQEKLTLNVDGRQVKRELQHAVINAWIEISPGEYGVWERLSEHQVGQCKAWFWVLWGGRE